MKEPTTEYSKFIQETVKINREFLQKEGWILKEEYPLYETYIHSKSDDILCSIGLYGEFYIGELHWMNKTPEREFSTINPNLTIQDYYKIIELLNIRQLMK